MRSIIWLPLLLWRVVSLLRKSISSSCSGFGMFMSELSLSIYGLHFVRLIRGGGGCDVEAYQGGVASVHAMRCKRSPLRLNAIFLTAMYCHSIVIWPLSFMF